MTAEDKLPTHARSWGMIRGQGTGRLPAPANL